MEFHQKLQTLRKERGMSQEALAGQLNVSRQAVSKWENGQGFPETEKLLQLSGMFGVSLDYLLKSDPPTPAGEEAEPGYYASREAVEVFLASKRVGARHTAAGVSLLILSVLAPILVRGNLGIVIMLGVVAIGVGALILEYFRPKPHQELETRPLVFDGNFLHQFRNGEYAAIRRQYGVHIVLGVILCILGVASVVLMELFLPGAEGEHYSGILLFVFVAVAVALFITGGSALGAANIVANNKAHIEEAREEEQSGVAYGFMMPLAAVAFMLMGFLWGAWHPGWLVFPLAAGLSAAFTALRGKK